MYENEDAVGAAVSASGIRRDDLFITTKVWHDRLTPDGIRRAFDRSLQALGLTHVDLYMVHWPACDMDFAAVMKTMDDLRSRAARARSVCATSTFPCNLRLDDEDRAAIAEFPKDLRYVRPPFAPDWDAE